MGAVKWPTRGKKARGGVFVWWGGCEGVGWGVQFHWGRVRRKGTAVVFVFEALGGRGEGRREGGGRGVDLGCWMLSVTAGNCLAAAIFLLGISAPRVSVVYLIVCAIENDNRKDDCDCKR